MPYKIIERDGLYCVAKEGDDSILSSYPTKQQAKAQAKALAISERGYKSYGSDVNIDNDKVSGYLIRFTDADNLNLVNTYFDRSTDLGLTQFSPKGKPILLEHGYDERFKSYPIGIVDLVREDEIGVWIEGHLNRREDYEAYLKEQSRRGLLDNIVSVHDIPKVAEAMVQAVRTFIQTVNSGWSSGCLPQSLEDGGIEEDGHINSWKVIEASITATPAEPNGTDLVVPIRSALDAIKADDGENIEIEEPKQGEIEMNEAQLLEKILEILTSYMADMEMKPDEAKVAEEAVAMMQDEEMINPERSLTEDDVKAFLVKNISTLITSAIRKENAFKQKLQDEARKAIEHEARKQNGTPKTHGVDSKTRISNVSNLKYAHMDAQDMLVGYKLMRLNKDAWVTDEQIGISEDYVKHMAHKASDYAEDAYRNNAQKGAEIKRLIPFRADELDASNIAGQGQEWVSQTWSTMVWEKARDKTVVGALLDRGMLNFEQINGETIYIPAEGNDPVVYASPQANDVDATGRPEVTAQISPFGTARVPITPKGLKAATTATRILGEDSVINVASQANRQLTEKLTETLSQLFINGNPETGANANINLIDGTPATGLTTPYYIAGQAEVGGVSNTSIRRLSLIDNTASARDGGVLAFANFIETLRLLPSAVRGFRNRLLWIMDADTELNAINLSEIKNNDFRGVGSTVGGILGLVLGIDTYGTGFFPLANTSGLVSGTPANNVTGGLSAVYAPYWAMGWNRNIEIETDRDILSGTDIWVASMRVGFRARGNNASALSYNLTAS